MRRTKYPKRFPISIEYDGKQYAASYYIEHGMVNLESQWGTKSAVIHNSLEEDLAKIMLREVLDAAKIRGDL
jgi:hypothetical protein